MSTLLQVDSSPLPGSVSRELTREFVSTWRAEHPEGVVIERDLALTTPAVLDMGWIYAAYTPEAARTAEQREALRLSEELIGELKGADEYVIGVSMHNFTIPGTLKLWIDQVVRAGETFSYGAAGPVGLLTGKKATVLVATGGVYSPGTPMGSFNFIEPYLRTILGFLGVTEVSFVTAGGTQKLMSPETDREAFLAGTKEEVRAMVA